MRLTSVVEKPQVGWAGTAVVAGPVFVFGGGVVEVLGGEDERREEDAVHGAGHALGDGGEPGLQSGEVDEGGH